MKLLFTLIKTDYLQRTRSYNFLIALCFCFALTYTFIPSSTANYSTIKIGNYIGFYNSAWIGYVTSIMASVILSIIGFYLISNTIKTDKQIKIDIIIASTSISNFSYLIYKFLSNFLILMTLLLIVFVMSVLLFFLYNESYEINIFNFIKPYVFITLPTLTFIAAIAVVFEVLFKQYNTVKNVVFFLLFSVLLFSKSSNKNETLFDLTGSKIVLNDMVDKVNKIKLPNEKILLNIGYSTKSNTKQFLYEGTKLTNNFIIKRTSWIFIAILLIIVTSPLFSRFNYKVNSFTRSVPQLITIANTITPNKLNNLPELNEKYDVFSLIKLEFLYHIKNTNTILSIVLLVLSFIAAFIPVHFAVTLILPISWFCQVIHLSSLNTKEVNYNTYFFTLSSHNPLSRVFTSSLLAVLSLLLVLVTPLLIRLLIQGNYILFFNIIIGSVFIVLLASLFGLLFKNNKVFEVVFFMISYLNINSFKYADYYGALTSSYQHIITITVTCFILIILNYFLKYKQINSL